MPSIERKFLHELGHLVVDLKLTGWAGWMMVDNVNNKEAFFCEPFVESVRSPYITSEDDWVNFGASVVGGWKAVELAIGSGHSEFECSRDPADEPGIDGYFPIDEGIIRGILHKNPDFDAEQFRSAAQTKALTVIIDELDTMIKVAKRLTNDYSGSKQIPFFYSRSDLKADFSHLPTTNI